MLKVISRTIAKLKRDGIKRSYTAISSLAYDHYFDRKYGIDTSVWVSHEDLVKENPLAEHTGHYQATNVLLIRQLLKRLNLPKTEIFLDIGAGKGRVSILASEYGFKEVRGIELSKNLCTIAERNIEIYKAKTKTTSNFEIINGDATQYKFLDDETILFMYNPFDGIILSKVLKNLKASLDRKPRKMIIIYVNPLQRKTLEAELNIKKMTDYVWNEVYTVYEL